MKLRTRGGWSPQHALNYGIVDYLYQHDHPDALLMVVYSGHGISRSPLGDQEVYLYR